MAVGGTMFVSRQKGPGFDICYRPWLICRRPATIEVIEVRRE